MFNIMVKFLTSKARVLDRNKLHEPLHPLLDEIAFKTNSVHVIINVQAIA